MTSHDVVQDIRRNVKQRRIGHTGTLDPNATGLLVICLGRATKIVRFLTGADKEYEAEICLGLSSATFDAEGVDKDQSPADIPLLGQTELEDLLAPFRGTIQQQVPIYSAVHVNGERLHKLARRGEAVEPPIREVTIHSIELQEYSPPFLRLLVRCSSGTYIRSLANDIGQKLGCGAYLSNLRRTAIGVRSVDDALSLEQMRSLCQAGKLQSRLLSLGQVLDFGGFTVSDSIRPRVLMGDVLHKDGITGVEGSFVKGDEVLLKDSTGHVLAVGHAHISATQLAAVRDKKLFSYIRVLN
jgi:tRNA pseudouridine55 synthase